MHLEERELDDALAFASRHLADRGVFYANVHLGTGRLGTWSGYPVLAQTLGYYESRAREAGLRTESLGRLCELGHVSGDRSCDSQFMLRFRRES
jgi:hypothetical protein